MYSKCWHSIVDYWWLLWQVSRWALLQHVHVGAQLALGIFYVGYIIAACEYSFILKSVVA